MKKLVLISSITLLLAACGSKSNKSEEGKKAQLQELKKQEVDIKAKIAVLEADLPSTAAANAISVLAVPIKPEIFKNYIAVQGRIDAEENVALSTEIPGTINKINVSVGDRVSKGQVLAETDTRALSESIADLQTNINLVNQIYQKQKNLWDQKIGTEIQFLQAKTNKESIEKKMGSLQEQIRMSKIISPIEGTVDAIDIKMGQLVAPGMPAIRVINFSNLKVKADVSESYASKIKKGNEVIVHFPDNDDSIVSKVNFVSRAINNSTRSFTVEVLLDNKKEYHPNMVAKLNINDFQSPKPLIAIPVRTIQKDESNASFVFIAKNNKAEKRIVTLGQEYNGKAEITSGLAEGDLLITAGYDLINQGDPITFK
ncbi:MAG: efflux RND transporter periplasmic adaptor subunit [Bacteroidia bacterium]